MKVGRDGIMNPAASEKDPLCGLRDVPDGSMSLKVVGITRDCECSEE